MITKSLDDSYEKMPSTYMNETNRIRPYLLMLFTGILALVFLDYNSEQLTGACSTLNPRQSECMVRKRGAFDERHRL